MVRTVGIDISSNKIAIAILYKKKFNTVELSSRSKDWLSRLDELYEDFCIFVKSTIKEDDVVFIEDVPFVQNRQTYFRLTHFLAMCRTVLKIHGYECTYVNNSTWKKTHSIKGKNSKAQKISIRENAVKIFGEDSLKSLSQDAIDALMIAKHAQLSSR